MATRTKKTAVIDPNSVEIAAFCTSQGINEQIFRLELMQHCEDADSTKTCDFGVAQSVAAGIQSTNKALPQTIETPESLTTEAIQPSQELEHKNTEENSQENSKIAVTQAAQGLEASHKIPSTKGQAIPTALSEFISKSQEDIELFDLVQIYRNEQIIQNAQSRDSELVAQLREQRLENRAFVFDQLRELNARQPVPQDLPELPASLSDEIAALSNELGKKLTAA